MYIIYFSCTALLAIAPLFSFPSNNPEIAYINTIIQPELLNTYSAHQLATLINLTRDTQTENLLLKVIKYSSFFSQTIDHFNKNALKSFSLEQLLLILKFSNNSNLTFQNLTHESDKKLYRTLTSNIKLIITQTRAHQAEFPSRNKELSR